MARGGWGASNFLRYTGGAVVALASASTMAAWIKPTTLTGTQSVINQYSTGDRSAMGIVLASGAAESAHVSSGPSAGAVTSAATVNAWNHVCGVFAAAGASRGIYLNGGGFVSEATSISPSALTRTSIGFDSAGGVQTFGGTFSGDIAEVGFWNVQLTAAEVAALARGTSPMLIRPSALVAYFPLIGANSPENNFKSNSVVMTVNGTLTKTAHPRIFMPPRRKLIANLG
jgi:hypothetical protein